VKLFSISLEASREAYDRYARAIERRRTESGDLEERMLAATLPRPENFAEFMQAVFFGSLVAEEGRVHKFSVVLAPAENLFKPYEFLEPRKLTPDEIGKLAPALENQAAAFWCWSAENDQVMLRGFTSFTGASFQVRSTKPGELLCWHGYGEDRAIVSATGFRFVDTGRFSLARALVPEEEVRGLEHDAEILARVKGTSRASELEKVAARMRYHRHGGTILVVPSDNKWRASVSTSALWPHQPYSAIREDLEAADKHPPSLFEEGFWERASRESADRSLWLLSRITAVDGAVVISRELDVFAVGAKIHPAQPGRRPEMVAVSEPFEDSQLREETLQDLGGMRHQSAAQFVFDQRRSIAIVASQDGRVSVFYWDEDRDCVGVVRNLEAIFSER
jgi:hypothetical protein